MSTTMRPDYKVRMFRFGEFWSVLKCFPTVDMLATIRCSTEEYEA